MLFFQLSFGIHEETKQILNIIPNTSKHKNEEIIQIVIIYKIIYLTDNF